MHAEGFNGGDRTIIELPKVQREMLEKLKTLGKPVIFVLCSGSAFAFDTEGLAAALVAWYPGQEGGKAVADVIYGDYNPAGRLPLTFYKSTSELNDFHDYDMLAGKGRTYRYYRGEPLFPFGYGLSYTEFKYADVQVTGTPFGGGKVKVNFRVENRGKVSGEEVTQIYVTALNVAGEPIKALKWFKRYSMSAGLGMKVEAVLGEEAFQTYDEATDSLVLKPGSYRVWVGGSSADKELIYQDITFTNSVKGSDVKGLSGWKLVLIVGCGFVAVLVIAAAMIVVRRRKEPISETPLLQ
jgi:beta-glucosidase